MNLGRLIARATIGGLFVGHGTQKLFGWFDGPGLDGAGQMMHSVDLRPGRRHAIAAGTAETAGGALLALGALMPVAGSLITGVMATAIRRVHYSKGLWNMDGGYEYNLALIAATTALVECGPGSPSVDRALSIERKGSAWAIAALAAGAAGSALAIDAGRRMKEREEAAVAGMEQRGRFVREDRTPTEAPASEREREAIRTSA
jgi:putative oxidoreductase